MKIINNTPWSSVTLREIARRVAAEELDPEHRKVAKVIFEPRGRHRVLGRGRIGASPQRPAMVAWVFLQSPERLRKVGKGYCGRDGCHRTYDAHPRVTDHRFERIDVELSLDGAEIAHVLAHEFQHNLGRRHRQMHRKYIAHDYTPWSWAGRVGLDVVSEPTPSARADEAHARSAELRPARERHLGFARAGGAPPEVLRERSRSRGRTTILQEGGIVDLNIYLAGPAAEQEAVRAAALAAFRAAGFRNVTITGENVGTFLKAVR